MLTKLWILCYTYILYLNKCMSESKSLSSTLKDALAKKHAADHPDAKQRNNKAQKPGAGNAPKGPPARRAASRGG